MKLRNGLYLIKSREDGLYLGETQQHHKPGMVGVPLTVVSLPGGVRAPEWHFHERDDGLWVITSEGCATFAMGEKVFALPMPFANAFGWKLERRPHAGAHVYTITDPDEPKGWVMDGKAPYTQVAMWSFKQQDPKQHHDVLHGTAPHEMIPTGAMFEIVPVPVAEQKEE